MWFKRLSENNRRNLMHEYGEKSNVRVILKSSSLDDHESDCIMKRNGIEKKKAMNLNFVICLVWVNLKHSIGDT